MDAYETEQSNNLLTITIWTSQSSIQPSTLHCVHFWLGRSCIAGPNIATTLTTARRRFMALNPSTVLLPSTPTPEITSKHASTRPRRCSWGSRSKRRRTLWKLAHVSGGLVFKVFVAKEQEMLPAHSSRRSGFGLPFIEVVMDGRKCPISCICRSREQCGPVRAIIVPTGGILIVISGQYQFHCHDIDIYPTTRVSDLP
jgi:hypothetical protein